MVATTHIILPLTRWILSDGMSISFISDPGIADVSLSRWPTFIAMDIIDSLYIFDLLLMDGSQ